MTTSSDVRAVMDRLERDRLLQPTSDSAESPEQELAAEMGSLRLQPPSISTQPTQASSTSALESPESEFPSRDFIRDFTFQLPVGCRQWPGPSYDTLSQLAPGVITEAQVRPVKTKPKPKQKRSKRAWSGGEQQLLSRKSSSASPRLKGATQAKPIRNTRYHERLPPRDEPLHLLKLPGEIRNQIYRRFCVSTESLVAQFRRVRLLAPSRKRSRKSLETTRRFPREPVLALVCRQMQTETLSLFYSENKFIFRHTTDAYDKNGEPSMVEPGKIQKWTPSFDFAEHLRHIEVHFSLRETTMKPHKMKYTLRKLTDGALSITNNADKMPFCACLDRCTIHAVQKTRASDNSSKSSTLLGDALTMIYVRREKILQDEEILNIDKDCPVCGLRRSIDYDLALW